MAGHKPMKAFLSPVLLSKQFFHKNYTLFPGVGWIKCNGLHYVSSRINTNLNIQPHHLLCANIVNFPIKTGLVKKKPVICNLLGLKMSMKFQHLPAKCSRNKSSQYQNYKLNCFTSLKPPLFSSAMLTRPNMLLGNLITRYKHTSTNIEDKELPMLFRHTKKPAGGGVEVKRRSKKKQSVIAKQDMKICSAYATAEVFYLDALRNTLIESGRFQPVPLPQDADGVLFMCLATPLQESCQDGPTEIIFFEEGTVVFWNATSALEGDVLLILERHQRKPYNKQTVYEENEQINYRHEEAESQLSSMGIIVLDKRDPEKMSLEKFAFSNAMMHTVKLAMWEESLDRFVDSIEYIPDHMSSGKAISISREEVMRKRGKLFALRHVINLSSDLLIASDFYWDRDNLEALYQKMCQFYNISRRTRVMNEKLTHCTELVELMRTHLSEKHSTRLEWMIILLIAVEVVFEFVHYIKLYLVGD